MLLITVPSFEEQTDPTGSLVTYYIVNIEDTTTKLKYTLMKRYSAFSELWDSLKDKHPEIASFRFPHKSMFHTHSKFTKDRRRQGFDDFMKMLGTLGPIPAKCEEFLELRDHIEKYERIVRANGGGPGPSQPEKKPELMIPQFQSQESLTKLGQDETSKTQQSSPFKLPGQALSSKNVYVDTNRMPQLLNKFYKSVVHNVSAIDDKTLLSEMEIDKEVQKMFPAIVRSSYAWTILIYYALIYSKIVDTTYTTTPRMVLTVLSVGCAICFARVGLIKRILHSRNSDTSAPQISSKSEK